jgi:hypothetical protein
MRKIYSFLFIALLIATGVHAQTGELQGKVIDAETNKGIGFAPVVILQGGVQKAGGYTEDDGSYSIKPINPGTYVVKVSFVGYNPTEVNNVLISSDKMSTLTIKMTKVVNEIKPVIITADRKLVDPDKTQTGVTQTKTEIQQLATSRNNPNDLVGMSAGVFQRDNGASLNVGGNRDYNNRYYVDGIPMRGNINLPSTAIEQLTLITGGIPAKYGDATGGIITITTRGPSKIVSGGLELNTSEFLDGFGYKLANFNISGPLYTKFKNTDSSIAKIGYFFSGEYLGNRDGDPSAVGVWRVKEDVLTSLRNNPLVPNPVGVGYSNRASFVRESDLQNVKAGLNVADNSFRFASKIDFRLNDYINITVGGNADIQLSRFDYDGFNSMFNFYNNPRLDERTYRGFVRFTQRFKNTKSSDGKSASVFQNAFYNIQVDYTHFVQKIDNDILTRPFDYSYYGRFKTHKAPIYSYTTDSIQTPEGFRPITAHYLTGFADTLVTFQPSEINPDLANYVIDYYTLSGSSPVDGVYGFNGNSSLYRSLNTILNNGGLFNGFSPSDIYSLYRSTGFTQGEIRKLTNDQYRVAFQGSVDIVRPSSIGGEKNRHALEFGFEYEQRDDRGYRVFPTGGIGIWGLARQLTNSHLVLDLNNPLMVYSDDGVFQDTVNYSYIDGGGQSFFDYNLRNKLGSTQSELLDINDMDPSTFSIDMFSPDELFNNGNNYIQYWGYDWRGNRLKSQPAFFDYFTKKETVNGREIFTRPIGAFRPIYTAAYIQDRFNFKDLVFNIGLRIDRYDANQKVLRDEYSLFPIRSVGDVTEINGNEIIHPDNIDDDYVVYVNNAENPTAILGYRKNDRWFDANGAEIADPKLIAQNSATGRIEPYLAAGYTRKSPISEEGFRDYEPQVNLLPRIAFSFPISDEALFFAHYDVLVQRPTNNRISPFTFDYFQQIAVNARFANPNLLPEKTIDYQVGFQQALSKTTALTIALTYKELKNMVQARNIVYALPIDYKTYGNIDFGTVKSLQVTYEMRRTRNIRMDLNYTLQFAEGTGSNSTSAVNLINSGQPNLRAIIPFSYDQRHTINATVDYRFAEGKDYNGPVTKNGKQILKNTGLNAIFRVGSGTPYTRQQNPTPDALFGVAAQSTLKGNLNGSRLPYTFKVDLRLDRDIVLSTKDDKKKAYINAFVLVQNALNNMNVVSVYSYTGSPTDDGYINSAFGQQSLQGKLDEQSYQDLYRVKLLNPGNFTRPRRIWAGVILNF